MNRWLVPSLLVVIGVLVVHAYTQSSKLSLAEATIKVLSEQNVATSSREKATSEKLLALESREKALAAESDQLRDKLNTAEPAPAAAPSVTPKPSGNAMSPLVKMMRDPKMRKMIASQQRMAMPMLYGDLVKELNLSPEDAKQFYDLLAEQQEKTMTAGMDMMDGKKDADLDPKAADPALRDLLGDDGFAKYQGYQKTMGERFAVSQFKQSLSGNNVLQDAQQQGLTQIMSEESAKAPSSVLAASNQAPLSEKMQAMNSPGAIDDYFKGQQAVNERVNARASQLLTGPQLDALKQFQDQQIQTQRMGIEMSKQMFAPASPTP